MNLYKYTFLSIQGVSEMDFLKWIGIGCSITRLYNPQFADKPLTRRAKNANEKVNIITDNN